MNESRLSIGLSLFLAFGCASAADGTEPDPVDEVITTQTQALKSAPADQVAKLCNRVFEFEHFVDVGDGVQLHVVEKFTGRSLLRSPRRGFLMLSPTLVTHVVYDTSVPGDNEGSFNSMRRAADAGFFSYALSYEGYGQSSQPADGKVVTAERSLDQVADVVQWILERRGVTQLDLMGMSFGAALAIALGGTDSPLAPNTVRSIVLTTHVYKNFTPEIAPMFGPEFFELLQSIPGGYIFTAPEFYGPVLSHVDTAAAGWAFSTFPGLYALGPTLEVFDLPIFSGANGRAPMLQVYGDQDPVTAFSDVLEFQEEYAGPGQLAILEGGAHSPMLEPVRDQFWTETLAFVNQGDEARSVCDRSAAAQ